VLHPLDPSNPDLAPFMVAHGRARVGLRLVDESDWLHRDVNFDADIRLKDEILADNAANSVGCLEGAEQSCVELLELIEEATGGRTNSVSTSTDTAASSRADPMRQSIDAATGSLVGPTPPPIDAAGRLVQEDLCVLDGTSLRLVAGSVCFPHGWHLADKLGLGMRDVHTPVPHYGDLADRADRPDLQRGLFSALDTMSTEERDYHGSHEPASLTAEHLRKQLGDAST